MLGQHPMQSAAPKNEW